MSGLFRSGHQHKLPLARRFALLALLVVQAMVTLAPLMEAHHEAPESHVEQNGATHVFVVHNEATCAVCTLRSLRQLASTASIAIPTAAPTYFASPRDYVVVLSRDEAAHAPRAPPVPG
jgi:hypothetical protein